MRIRIFLGLVTLFATVASEICQNCSNNDGPVANFAVLDTSDKVLVAAKPPSSSPPPPLSDPSSAGPPDQFPDFPQYDDGVGPATDEFFEKCRQKGCLLEWSTHQADNEVGPYYVPPRMSAQSPYQSWDGLETWNWFERDAEDLSDAYYELTDARWGIDVALRGLGVSPDTEVFQGGPNEVISIMHEDLDDETDVDEQGYEVDGRYYPNSGADYVMSINTKDGVVIGMNRKGPMEAGKERIPPLRPEDMPKLHQFSDVGWIAWKTKAEAKHENVKNLRYFISIAIENAEIRSVCMRVFRNYDLTWKEWPGNTFIAGSDNLHALLGTPNIQGFAYMLIQHKADLGNMYIGRIQVFKGTGGALCIVAHVLQPRTGPPNPMAARGQVTQSNEGSNILRVHKLFAKL